MGNIDVARYVPPGPVGAAFIHSRGPIDIIMGPAGSGKTVASCIKGPLLAASYMPVCRDGRVRVKLICVRDTYRDFARTALASWHEMFPVGHPWQRPDKGYEGGQDRPVRHHLVWEAWRGPDKVIVEFTLETGAIADSNVMQFVKGYEVSMAWGNEVDMMSPEVPGALFMRTGRYPPVKDIAPSELDRVSRDGREAMRRMGMTVDDTEITLPRMFWGDMNPPDVDHPLLKEVGWEDPDKKNPAYNFFRQPGGLDDGAENRVGRPRSAYEMDLRAMSENLSRRMVHGLPGYAQDGKPVYPEYNEKIHKADQPLAPTPGRGITIGIDGGGSPSATIGQPQANGQERLLAELVTEPGTGPTRFSLMLLELLMSQFSGLPIIGIYGDPAIFYGGDKETDEMNFAMTVQKTLRFPILPAPSNEPGVRQDAVRMGLTTMIDGRVPGYLVDPRCKMILGGFAAHYKLTKQATIGGTDKLAVVKNAYSHPHDAEQYRRLGYIGLANVVAHGANSVLPSGVVSLHEQRLLRNQPKPQRPGDFSVWDV
ncbi:hypothetical protein [Agrobacterium sp. LMR679]|uniref:hypothetical protein n=1 Tax=Agrobacterium sp. LMR679 TaxID=3014335 RepID=UPI0022B0003C|nr:hypothetical protein [Agrobacterium sp. LMR679]MCZ4073552.1 hypothetical protein [Agrobacterium sp. LMR679]MCZ4076245.1 hypothetical protein [Agrobacterium sp. LMR679]